MRGAFQLVGRNAERVLSGGEKIRVTEAREERGRESDFATANLRPAISPHGEIERSRYIRNRYRNMRDVTYTAGKGPDIELD